MTAKPVSTQTHLTAFLGGPDRPDIRNPIHSTQGAKQYGYGGALVGGVTVYGWATPAIMSTLGVAWLEHGWADVAFRRPVYPGFELIIRVTERGDGAFDLFIGNAEDVAYVVGTIGLGKAPWFDDLTVPERRGLDQHWPQPASLTLDSAPIGQEIGPMVMSTDVGEMIAYATKQRSNDPLFTGSEPLLHPGLLAGMNTRLFRDQFDTGAAIHATSRIQHLALARAGVTFTTYGHFVDAYERKGHHYMLMDVAVVDDNDVEVARIRQDTIFHIARRSSA